MDFVVSLTKRTRNRKLTSGSPVAQVRYVLNYRDPITDQRRQEFFDKQKDAQVRKGELILSVGTGTFVHERTVPTVALAVDHWLSDRERKVKPNTLAGYKVVIEHVRGPYLVGTPEQRAEFRRNRKAPKGTKLVPLLGATKLTDLTTAQIRTWHREVATRAGAYTANRAKSHLKGILALAEEDFGVRAPSMPTGLGKSRGKAKKAILSTLEIAAIVDAARADPEHGLYYAFPFLAGTRPSEQLGLLWEDVDFDLNVIRIRRIQERDGTLTQMTKTEAGTREVPMGAVLREMLLAWRLRCPRRHGDLHRVFPGPGRLGPWPKARTGGGGPLLYQNYRKRYWQPLFERLALPYVTPHSARHSFISTMQAEGIEVGLVAKIAGHASPAVTLGHYTQAVRGGESAIAALERAYGRTAFQASSPVSAV